MRHSGLRSRIDLLAAKPCLQHRDVFHLVDRAGQNITIEHNKVGQFPDLQRSLFLFFKGQERVVEGIKPQGLFASNQLFRMQWCVRPAWLTSQRGPDSQDRIVIAAA